ncbi:MAG: DUF1491 family protein [Pseudomonadota bacterium]
MTEQIPTHIWLDSQIRRLSLLGHYVMIVRRGNPSSGTIILQCRYRDGTSHIYTQTRDATGELAWLTALSGNAVADRDADAYIRDAIAFDPDAWAVEIAWDNKGTVPFEGRIV